MSDSTITPIPPADASLAPAGVPAALAEPAVVDASGAASTAPPVAPPGVDPPPEVPPVAPPGVDTDTDETTEAEGAVYDVLGHPHDPNATLPIIDVAAASLGGLDPNDSGVGLHDSSVAQLPGDPNDPGVILDGQPSISEHLDRIESKLDKLLGKGGA